MFNCLFKAGYNYPAFLFVTIFIHLRKICDMQLSKNFSLAEMLDSLTAANLNYKEQFEPSPEIIENLRLLCVNVLQPLRDYLGKPISISSGYRCARLNKQIGGSITSEHMQGMAADIKLQVNGLCDNKKIFDAIVALKLPFTQLISEFGTVNNPQWIHVSYNKKNIKREKLRAESVKGKTVYTPIK